MRYASGMAIEKGRHYIRAWRKYRGLSLRRLADRLELDPAGDSIASHARLQRVENGEVGYTEELLQALAHALNVSIVDLLERDPTKEGRVVDLTAKLSPSQREEAQKFMEFLIQKAG